MNRILLFCALGALWGCRTVTAPTTEAITLCYSTSEPSKTDALTEGDAVTVFARMDGTETYFLEGAKYVVGSDGHSLTYGSTVYYPETKQAVNFYAYFGGAWDEGQGTCSVPSDQSTPAALKQADLCWASASSTPVPTPVSLTFQHLFARLIVHTNKPTEPTSKIACQVVPSGVLNAATAQFVLGSDRKEVWTTGTELILPVQPLSRLVLTVSGIEYVFEGSINLQSGQTTTLNLTLNPSTKTATLNGSSTTDWTASNQNGTPTEAVSNVLTLHWPKCHPQSGAVDKIVLRVKDQTTNTTADYTISSGITYADQTFTVPFASAAVFYPYTIENIQLYKSLEWIHCTTKILGATIGKKGAVVLGVKQPLSPPTSSDYIKIGSLYWTKGFLVGVNNYECTVGTPIDEGVYFQCGSLIGWKGGDQANGGNGRGRLQVPLTTNGTFWNGASFSWEGEASVWPTEMIGTKSVWSATIGSSTLNEYFFNYSAGKWSGDIDFRSFNDLPGGVGDLGSGRYANLGVGDACTYYLGAPWRLPTSNEAGSLTGGIGYVVLSYSDPTATIRWVNDGAQLSGIAGPGAWMGGDMNLNCTPDLARHIFCTASGARSSTNGSFMGIKTELRVMGTTVHWAEYYMGNCFFTYEASRSSSTLRGNAWPARCVRDVD